jgi:phenylacetate-CoA ligase
VTASPAAYARRFDSLVAGVLADAAARVGALRDRLRAAGLEPGDLTDVAALDRLPVLSKDELIDLQASDPPFGGLLAPDAPVRRVFQSPGPLYEPELDERDPWRWRAALDAAGFAAGDVVVNASGYHLTPLGAMFEEAVLALGGTVVPAGVGNLDLQVRACVDLGASAYIGLPSYLKALLDKAEELGATGSLRLERAFVTAEPLPPSLRAWLEERVRVVRQGYGTAETGNLGYECERKSGFHVPDDALVQVCDLDTGRALWNGEEGQVVATLFRADYPLVRIGTGDLSAFATDPCECGRPAPRIVGWLGRVGEAVKVRGMFLHPRQAQAALAGVPEVARFRLLVDRVEHRDTLRCEVVGREGTDPDRLASIVRERIRSTLRFDADVVAVDAIEPEASLIADIRSWD